MKTRTVLARAALIALAVVLFVGIAGGYFMIGMPGTSYDGDPPEMTAERLSIAEQAEEYVRVLADDIGARNVMRPDEMEAAADYLEEALLDAGYERVDRHSFDVDGVTTHNLEVEISGGDRSDEIVVVGAHYDSAYDAPGANDNASGVAGTLALAERFAGSDPSRTLRFVLFANEEPPFFQTESMGSLVYARRSEERAENIVAMISLETIGYFDDTEGSQQYPIGALGWVYPTRGNFVAFVGNLQSRSLVRQSIRAFREVAEIPSEGAALPDRIPGVGWSDHWAFWQAGYPAIMITDTAPFRYPHYHTPEDTPDKLDFRRMAVLIEALEHLVATLVDDY